MRNIRITALAFFMAITLAGYAQKTPPSLLWRISGNGLQKPSYLFGTMHLTDKRLFNFSDSVYHAIGAVEGFAMEIDISEMMDSIFRQSIQNAEDEMMQKNRVKINKNKLDRESRELLKKLGINEEEVDQKQLKKVRDYRMNKLVQKGEMETIVDGFLYGIAQRKGKWMGAVEDVADQLDLKDELGGALSPDQVFIPEKDLKRSLDVMIDIYLREDLDSMQRFMNQYPDEFLNSLLYQRNAKMARRIDSLMAIRTMFFAVGAAHLPGQQGLIDLLRKKGFSVEPVFAVKRTPGAQYLATLSKIPWQKVEEEMLPYTIELPGKPSDYDMFGNLFRFKIIFDLPTMTLYMTGHMPSKTNQQVDMDKLFGEMSRNMTGKVVKPKKKKEKDFTVYEAIIEDAALRARVQLVNANDHIYMLFAFSNSGKLNTVEIERYFSSFRPLSVQYPEGGEYVFRLEDKGMAVQLPGEPKQNTSIDRAAEGTSWQFYTYDYIDNSKGLYYMVQVKETGEGSFITSDSIYFAAYLEDIKGKMNIVSEERFKYKGYPAHKIDALHNGNILYRIIQVIRGNRIYLLLVGGNSDGLKDADAFLNSLQLLPYQKQTYTKQSAFGFSSMAPAPFKISEKDEDEEASEEFEQGYTSHDRNNVTTYYIHKSQFQPFTWFNSEEDFINDRKKRVVDAGDSLVSMKKIMVGSLPGYDFVVEKQGGNSFQHVRLFVNRDTLYTIFSISNSISPGAGEEFYNNFRVVNEVAPVIFNRQPAAVLEALASSDSLSYAKGSRALATAEFLKEDLPLLHKAYQAKYHYGNDGYYSIRSRIADEIVNLKDSSSINFISGFYNEAVDQFELLGMLGNMETAYAYEQIKKLLERGLPKGERSGYFERSLLDSLELSRMLFPDILKYTSDSLFADITYDLARKLVKNEHIPLEMLQPYRALYFQHAGKVAEGLKVNENWYSYTYWLNFISMYQDKEAVALARQFLSLPHVGMKKQAILSLLEMKQEVPQVEIIKVAADTGFRADFYEALKEKEMLKIFPAKFATQRLIGESQLYNIASEDYTVHKLEFLNEVTETIDGVKKVYYLYRVVFQGEEGSESYLGIIGPFKPGSKEIITGAADTGVYWEEQFDKARYMEQFRKYISE